jgi:dCTP deaminase
MRRIGVLTVILTRDAIRRHVESGDICIDPYDPELTNPNSHNYRLGLCIRMLTDAVLDPMLPASTVDVELPQDGFVLNPGRLYLGATLEKIGSHKFVPSLIGRSSLGRLGLFLQVSADLGQLGAIHHWTLELVATQPIRVYPRMVIGQVSFWQPTGARLPYRGYCGTRSDPAPWLPMNIDQYHAEELVDDLNRL